MTLNVTNTNIRLAYKGPFYIDILSSMGSYIRQMFNNQPLTSNRLYKLFFELTQNVSKYSAESSNLHIYKYSGVGSFCLEEIDGHIILCTSNLIRNEDGLKLQKYCNEINFMNKAELRRLRSEKRKIQPQAIDTGAHIGIIQIGILTHNQIDFTISSFDDTYSVFSLKAKIAKE
jgi:hypothetical protein